MMNTSVCVWVNIVLAALFFGSCVVYQGCGNSMKARFERTVELEYPMAAGSAFSAETAHGKLIFCGDQTDLCRLNARIRVQAKTEELAREIAEQIEVSLVPSSGGIAVKIDRPPQGPRYSCGVDLTATIPSLANIDARTSHGNVKVSAIEGTVNLGTSHGNITAENLTGSVNLNTSHGNITVEQVTGPIHLNTSYGNIDARQISGQCAFKTSHGKIRCSQIQTAALNLRTSYGSITVSELNAPDTLKAEVNTSHGDIEFTAPPDFAGHISLTARQGSIRTDRPVNVQGRISNERIQGTVGTGPGELVLETSYGNITLR